MADPSILFGIHSLMNDDDMDVDLDELEREITNTQDNIPTFESEVDKVVRKTTPADSIQDAFPAKSIIHDDFFTDLEPKKVPKKVMFDTDSSDEEDIPIRDNYLKKRTDNERRANIANRALQDIDQSNAFDFHVENERDEKIALIEEIDMLIEILDEENIDISRIKKPSMETSIKEMHDIRRSLQLKNDRNRSRTLAEESFLTLAHGMEYAFDGKRDYFGRRPDLTGWPDTVNVKLRRMRFETSSFVSGVMRQYNMGPLTRIALELIPSMFIYSRMQKKKHNDDLFHSDEMNLALDRIRDNEESDK